LIWRRDALVEADFDAREVLEIVGREAVEETQSVMFDAASAVWVVVFHAAAKLEAWIAFSVLAKMLDVLERVEDEAAVAVAAAEGAGDDVEVAEVGRDVESAGTVEELLEEG
jgi:hypothetical protein